LTRLRKKHTVGVYLTALLKEVSVITSLLLKTLCQAVKAAARII